MGHQFNNPYDFYQISRALGNGYFQAAKDGAVAFAQSPGLKSGGRIAGRLAPVALAGLDYMENRADGENQQRAIASAAGSGLGAWGGAAAGATAGAALGSIVPVIGTGIGGVIGGIGGALLGSNLGNAAVDTGFKVFTEDDGLEKGSAAYRQHYGGLVAQAKADYNNNPTPENKQRLERYQANATGTTTSGGASSAQDEIDRYNKLAKAIEEQGRLGLLIDQTSKELTGYSTKEIFDPNGKYQQSIRDIDELYAHKAEQMKRRGGIFDTTQAIIKGGADRSLKAVQTGADIANKLYGGY